MDWINNIDWVKVGFGYVVFIQWMKAIRDAIDTTPNTDDNWFERTCTIMGKFGASVITGARPK